MIVLMNYLHLNTDTLLTFSLSDNYSTDLLIEVLIVL